MNAPHLGISKNKFEGKSYKYYAFTTKSMVD
jgi:hypothetical protein